jgi:hypothetical protein
MKLTVIGASAEGSIFAFGLYETVKKAEERIESLQEKHPSISFFWIKINK